MKAKAIRYWAYPSPAISRELSRGVDIFWTAIELASMDAYRMQRRQARRALKRAARKAKRA